MASTTAITTSFKQELMVKDHDFTLSTGDTFKIALYTSTATNSATTTAYTATNEVSGTNYVAKGNTLTNVTPTTSGTTAFTDFADTTWSTATITAASCLIFNEDAAGDDSVLVQDFGGDKTSTAADFQIVFPTADSSNAIIRLA